jgi:hypothetical protein
MVAMTAAKVEPIKGNHEHIKGPLTKGKDIKQNFLIKASCETQAWPNPSQQRNSPS